MRKLKACLTIVVAAAMVVALLCLPGCGEKTGDQSEKLSTEVREVLDAPEFKYSSWTIKAVDLETGKEIYEQVSPNRMLDPASNTKIYTVATAFDTLGQDYRFETPVYEQGTTSPAGKLDGNLILVASGDLVMGGRATTEGGIDYTDMDHTDADAFGTAILTEGDPLAGLDNLAQQVAASGIKTVSGDVIIDDRLYGPAPPFGGEYVLTPIIINDNLIDVVVKPTTPGSPAEVTWRPMTAMYTVEANVSTVSEGEDAAIEISSPGAGVIKVEGKIPAGSDDIVKIFNVEDPSAFARTLFIEALKRSGVSVSAPELGPNPAGKLPPEAEYTNMKRAALLESPPFSEYAKLILKVSHNMGANTLLFLIAVHEGKDTFDDGLQIEGAFLKKAGVDVGGVVLNDGEGAPGADFVCANATVQLLRYISTQDYYKAYKDALPIMAVDGTLTQLLSPKSPIKGKVQAKTGTHFMGDTANNRLIMNARALGGYMTTKSGRELAFQIIMNNVSVGQSMEEGKKLMDKHAHILEIIYEKY